MEPNIPPSLFPLSLCFLGFIISAYALYVEFKTSHSVQSSTDADGPYFHESEFKALCDIESIGASCSAVFKLPEGRLLTYFSIVPEDSIFDIPNAGLGLLYYVTVFTVETFSPKARFVQKLTILLNAAALSSSIFLAIKLIQLGEFCIVCWTAHIINSILILFYSRRFITTTVKKTKKQ